MNTEQLRRKTMDAVRRQCRERGYATPVDVLMDIGVLTKQKYEDWRFGRILFLEAACTANLKQLSEVVRTMRSVAAEDGLKASICTYTKWGRGRKMELQFSKSRNPSIERGYATHFVDSQRITELKTLKAKETEQAAARSSKRSGN